MMELPRHPFGGGYFEVFSTGLLVGTSLWLLWSWYKKKSEPTLRVGVVSNIFMYPVKSVTGVSLEEAMCSPVGLQFPGTDIRDRNVVITTNDYKFLTMRQEPSLALVKASIHGNKIHLDAPNMDTLVVNRDTGQHCTVKVFNQPASAMDCGDEAADWLSTFLKKEGVRLCVSAHGTEKRFLKEDQRPPLKARYQNIKENDQVIFSDVAPFMVVSDASLEDLNTRMDPTLSMRTFRPNITISGCPPFDEDTWKVMQIGEARFTFAIHCPRCILTQVDPETGSRRQDEEPLKTLRTYRLIDPVFEKSPCFGTQWVLIRPGIIRVGDPVYVSKG